jgi:hypothetical protein
MSETKPDIEQRPITSIVSPREDAIRTAVRVLQSAGLTPFDILERTWLLELWGELKEAGHYMDLDLAHGLRDEIARALWNKAAQPLSADSTWGEYLTSINVPKPDL